MIVSHLLVQAAVANGVMTPEEMSFLLTYRADESDDEDDERMEQLCQRLVLWATPSYNREEV